MGTWNFMCLAQAKLEPGFPAMLDCLTLTPKDSLALASGFSESWTGVLDQFQHIAAEFICLLVKAYRQQ